MHTKSPVTITSSLSQEELLDYLKFKLSANKQLKMALTERESLQLQLQAVDARIDELTSSAALELISEGQDPTHHP